MEAALVKQRYGNGTYAAHKAWKKCTVAGEIVAQAFSRMDPSWREHPKRMAEAIGKVSGYARQNPSETMAECIVDVYANGRRAQPLSKAVFEVTKQMMGGIQGAQ